jgi:nucleoid DNA-binding protein
MTEIKPNKLPLKNYLIKKIAIKMRISESIVENVINDQFKGIAKAMLTEDSVEMTGFGKFMFLPIKANKMRTILQNALDKKLNGEDVPNIMKDIPTLQNDIAYLTKRIENAGTSKADS